MASSSSSPFKRSVSSQSVQSAEEMDWDRSLIVDSSSQNASEGSTSATTPRNSVLFPMGEATPVRSTDLSTTTDEPKRGERTLSELLKLHAEKGTTPVFTQEEANRVGDVLGQWINSSSSPYEGDDDFFVRGKDDMFIPSKRIEAIIEGRQRGMSVDGSRPPSSAAGVFGGQ